MRDRLRHLVRGKAVLFLAAVLGLGVAGAGGALAQPVADPVPESGTTVAASPISGGALDPKLMPGSGSHALTEAAQGWEKLKFGLFIHWGIYSLYAGQYEGKDFLYYAEQIQMRVNYGKPNAGIPKDVYLKKANDDFKADKYDPKAICQMAKDAGMRYVVLTSKHHDGFAMFNDPMSDYNIVKQTPYAKDAFGELANACRAEGLKVGLYYSLVDWNAGHDHDINNLNPIPESMEPLILGQLTHLMTAYGDISEVWFDMSSPTPAQSKKFAAKVHELQPNAFVNSRVWNRAGDYEVMGDNALPHTLIAGPWQAPATIYRDSWGYVYPMDDPEQSSPETVRDTTETELNRLAGVIAQGGNYLLNVGPRGDGSITPGNSKVLAEIGKWGRAHPGVLDSSTHRSPYPVTEMPYGYIAENRARSELYLMITKWPTDGKIVLDGLLSGVQSATLDGNPAALALTRTGNDVQVTLPDSAPDQELIPVIRLKLDGPARVMRSDTGTAGADGSITLPESALTEWEGAGWGKARVDGQVLNPKPAKYDVVVQSEDVPADQKVNVTIGETTLTATGAQLASGQPIGQVALAKANAVEHVSIELTEPTYWGDPVTGTFKGVTLTFVEDIEPEPSPTPSPTPSPEPSPTPTPEPSPEPSPTPTPSPEPSQSPSPEPTPEGQADVQVTSSELVIGEPTVITVSGFFPGENVRLELHSEPLPLGELTADAAGRAIGLVTIPANAPAGSHRIVATGITSGRISSVPVTVATSLATATTASSTPVPGKLSNTGAGIPVLPLVGGAFALILAGAGALVLTRRHQMGAHR